MDRDRLDPEQEDTMTIKAKFQSKCRICGEAIQVGETVEWVKGVGVQHPESNALCAAIGWARSAPLDDLVKAEAGYHGVIDNGVLDGEPSEKVDLFFAVAEAMKAEIQRRSDATAGHTAAGTKATPDEDLRPGVFEKAGEIFVVKPNRDKTRLYAKRLVEVKLNVPRVLESGEAVEYDVEFEYAKGAVYDLAESDRMDIERAKLLAIRYGRCISCGRTLKARKSVEAGIGPVCRKGFSRFSEAASA